jgi:hypothetical protein
MRRWQVRIGGFATKMGLALLSRADLDPAAVTPSG